jgi:N-acetylmuramoyl-L-alanine amidase
MSIKEIIFTKGQFDVVGNGTIHNEPIPLAIEVAKKVLNGYRMMPDDVYYFYNPKIAGDSWIKTRKVWKRIGDHLFCYR